MCTRPLSLKLPPNPYEYACGYRSPKILQVPCGKCPECLGKRQKDISLRAYREAKKYGSCFFVTLTYSPDCVPFAQTLIDIDMESGESLVHSCAELCTSDMLPRLKSEYHKHKEGVFTYIHDLCKFENHHYQIIYTPTLYYSDVRLAIKNFRVRQERENGVKTEFSYIAVGEYGNHNTCRPHYHILFFGLNRMQVFDFCNLWRKGRYYVVPVKFVNEDGSDGIAKVASYIGKYAAKGSFNHSTVVNRYVLPCRLASSRGLGLSDLSNLVSYYRAYDVAGKYDIEKLDFSYEKTKLYEIIFNRLKYNFNGHEISLPISFRRKIFDYRLFDGRGVWSRLYYEVMDFARSKYKAFCDSEFKRFADEHSAWSLSKVASEFTSIQEAALASREENQRQNLIKFYSCSKF